MGQMSAIVLCSFLGEGMWMTGGQTFSHASHLVLRSSSTIQPINITSYVYGILGKFHHSYSAVCWIDYSNELRKHPA